LTLGRLLAGHSDGCSFRDRLWPGMGNGGPCVAGAARRLRTRSSSLGTGLLGAFPRGGGFFRFV